VFVVEDRKSTFVLRRKKKKGDFCLDPAKEASLGVTWLAESPSVIGLPKIHTGPSVDTFPSEAGRG
jgi:hypothetical protein